MKLLYRILLTITVWFGLILDIYNVTTRAITNQNSVIKALINLFSYFTVQSNLMIAIWFTLAIIFYKKKKMNHTLKGAFTLYITITGIIYVVMLSGIHTPVGFAAITSNLILHYIIPVAAVLDWVFFEERKTYLWKYSFIWLIYPLSYFGYSLIRGSFTKFYPYPFINVTNLGFSRVLINAVVLSVVFTILGMSFVGINKLLKTHNQKK